ncbi:hypothetical protein ACOME3_007499 [Neoechinorhynchus agilis]
MVLKFSLSVNDVFSETEFHYSGRTLRLCDDHVQDCRMARHKCGVCLDTIKEYGLLDCCDHQFCIECIQQWRQLSLTQNHQSCPCCRRICCVIARSKRYLPNGPEKQNLMIEHAKALSIMECPYNLTEMECIYGTSCPYTHSWYYEDDEDSEYDDDEFMNEEEVLYEHQAPMEANVDNGYMSDVSYPLTIWPHSSQDIADLNDFSQDEDVDMDEDDRELSISDISYEHSVSSAVSSLDSNEEPQADTDDDDDDASDCWSDDENSENEDSDLFVVSNADEESDTESVSEDEELSGTAESSVYETDPSYLTDELEEDQEEEDPFMYVMYNAYAGQTEQDLDVPQVYYNSDYVHYDDLSD